MEAFILFKYEIRGKLREIKIYPIISVPGLYLIILDGVQIGTIKKMDNYWSTNTIDLMSILNELGKFIDANYGFEIN